MATISVLVGLAAECLPVPGFFVAALFFPGGFHGDNPLAFMMTERKKYKQG